MSKELLPPDHTDESTLVTELEAVKNMIYPGDVYHHYKDPAKLYKILGVSLLESTEEVAIIYQSLYGHKITWVRTWKNWSESVEYNGVLYPRFKQVNT
jgi:hypothetical protein